MKILCKYYVVSLLIISISFTACSHENPLETNSLSISGEFLYDASFYAEQNLNAGNAHGGKDFGLCVEDKAQYSKKYCKDLYHEIVIFAKNNKGAFKNLTLEDLTDATAYFQLKSYYDHHVYMEK